MEACESAHYWGRQAQAHGHRVVLLPPHTVRPYVLRNKTDRSDAKGLLEASRRPASFALHRTGDPHRSHQDRTRLAARVRRGHPDRRRHVVPSVGAVLEDADSGVPSLLRSALAAAVQEIREIEARLRAIEHQLDAVAEQMPLVSGLRSIPGIGLLTATALVATVGDVQRFPSARHFASYLGLTPREHSSGAWEPSANAETATCACC